MRKIITLIFALVFSGCSSNPTESTESSGYSYCSQPYFSTLGYYDLSGNFNGCFIGETISFPDGYVATCAENIPRNIDKKVVLLQKVTEVDESYDDQGRVTQNSRCVLGRSSSDFCFGVPILSSEYLSKSSGLQDPIRIKRQFYKITDHKIVARITKTNSFGSGEETTYDITFPNYHTGGCVWKDANGEEFMTEDSLGAMCSLTGGASALCN